MPSLYNGSYTGKIDPKRRVFVPSNLRKKARKRCSKYGSFQFFLYSGFEGSLAVLDRMYILSKYSSLKMGMLHDTKLDSQNRILIPREIAKKYCLEGIIEIAASDKGDYFTISKGSKK